MEKEKNNLKMPWWQPSLLIFTRLSGWIGGPIIIAIFIGKWLDKRYETEPWWFLFLVGFAFIVSTMGITKDAIREMNKLENEGKKAKDKISKK